MSVQWVDKYASGQVGRRAAYGSTRSCDLRTESVGELNFRVTRWLNKVLMVHFTVSASSPSAVLG
eukprot:8123124-Pyramimonas_sp.AAC.1